MSNADEGGSQSRVSRGRGFRSRGGGGPFRRVAGRMNSSYGRGKLNDDHMDDIVGPIYPEAIDMTPVRPEGGEAVNPALREWMKPLLPIPREPIKFEPPETNEHIEALEFMQSFKKDRQLMKCWRMEGAEFDYFDCSGMHGISEMCQFCDGRRGPWVRSADTQEPDEAFLRYQESVINSLPARCADPAVLESLNPSKLGTLGEDEDAKYDYADAEYGVPSSSFSILG
ncbi:hypothetical protein Ocin01_12730 [Orchesella cincta]|uniref:Uncharacterized protein n=1 Tax=Orchesella cincta TaxID=48709 RepID=A0A1D2MM07_ORCCI|nr:hypothetical protein Ocin01_12730 [Orchesella cincta]